MQYLLLITGNKMPFILKNKKSVMKKWIQNFFGITQIIEEKKKQTNLLENIYKECKKNSDLVEAYNRAYHIR